MYFIYLFLAVLGLRCCKWAFSSRGELGLLFIAVLGLLIVVASLVAEHGLQAHGLHQLQHTGSVVAARRLSCSAALGSSRNRARTRVPCIGRRILNHCATREVQHSIFLLFLLVIPFLLSLTAFLPLAFQSSDFAHFSS